MTLSNRPRSVLILVEQAYEDLELWYPKLRLEEEGMRVVLELVRAFDRAKKPIAMICHAGWVPISARILSGRRVTGVAAIRDDLENAGASFVDRSVVVDGHLISSRTPADLPDFCRALIAALRATVTT